MVNDLEYIDDYFRGKMGTGETGQFEQRILEDPGFAEEVAFYLNALQAAREQIRRIGRKEQFWEIIPERESLSPPPGPIGKLWPYIAVAAVVAGVLLGGWWFFLRPVPEKQLADQFIQQHFQALGISMGSKEDSLQTGLRLYNEGKWTEALRQFENIARSDDSAFEAKKYAGIVSLQLKDYDKALTWFDQLSHYTLYVNPGLFYQAITLMERNRPDDPEHAKQLLLRVVQEGLEGKETAAQWLSKL